jgi:hypothetical protein
LFEFELGHPKLSQAKRSVTSRTRRQVFVTRATSAAVAF